VRSRSLPLAAAAGLVILLGACTTVSVMRLKDYESRRPTRNVDVYASAQSVTRPYKEMAVISCDDKGNGHREAWLEEKLVEKAKEIGADGLILETPQTSTAWGTSRTVTRALAIVYQ
jgi:hypothetical protein